MSETAAAWKCQPLTHGLVEEAEPKLVSRTHKLHTGNAFLLSWDTRRKVELWHPEVGAEACRGASPGPAPIPPTCTAHPCMQPCRLQLPAWSPEQGGGGQGESLVSKYKAVGYMQGQKVLYEMLQEHSGGGMSSCV